MYGYAGSSATASQLTPFSQPAQTTNATGLAAQAAATAQASGTSTGTATSNATSASTTTGLSSLLSDLTSSTGSSSDLTGLVTGSDDSALGTFLSSNFFSTMVVNGAIAGGPFNPQFILQSLAGFSFLQGAKGAAGASGLLNLFNPGALGSAGVPSVGGFGSGLSAAMGEAGRAGALSVPPSWSAVAPTSPIASALGGTPLAPPGPLAGGPGGVASPMSNVNGRLRRAIPKYGMRLPPMMTRPPAAG
jgi:PPE-repeat protein